MYRNAIDICITSYSKFANFRWKNADFSRTQRLFDVINIFFGLLYVRHNCAKFHHWKICVRHLREGESIYIYILLHILLYIDSSKIPFTLVPGIKNDYSLSFTMKISIFSEAYIYNTVEHLWSFYCENIHKKCSIVDTCLASKYVSAFTWRLFKRSISLKHFTL